MAIPDVDEERIFNLARKVSGADARAEYLTQVCGGNAALQERIEALLRAHAEEGFMKSPPVGPAATIDQPITERVGTMIGPYKLMEQIGEGGFGLVFVAEQTQPVKRRVALKVIKPGMDSKQVIARFEAERQALALMDHPNIARVLDAGSTESGRPYFVMELVRGIPITDYCDQSQLTPRERLEVFVSVCNAIQHAHQKGIIHRDVKPSNVLVTLHDGKPVAKVIDFGVAKAIHQHLTERTIYTSFAQMIGTPLYMSPEQAEMSGLDIDTRSDIYSLGVLLYELLTGTTPLEKNRFAQAAYDEIRRLIREEEPPRPSHRLSTSESLPSLAANRKTEPAKLPGLLKGELDWVVMKALEKDRTRRYETANGLARDIQRYLADEVVEARPPSTAYRLRKFARRHKAQVIAAGLVLLALLAGMAGTTFGLIRAEQQRQLAEQERQSAERQRQLAEQARAEEQQRAEGERQARLALKAESERTRAALRETKRQLAIVALERAESHRRAGEAGEGLLQLVEAVRVAGEAGSADIERGARTSIAVWQNEVHKLRSVMVGGKEDEGVRLGVPAFGADGKTVLVGSLKTAELLDVATGKRLCPPLWFPGLAIAVAISPNGRVAAVAEATIEDPAKPELMRFTVHLWDTASGKPLGAAIRHPSNPKTGSFFSGVQAIAFSPDSKTLLTGGVDRTVRRWDAATGKEVNSALEHPEPISSLAFSIDGRVIAAKGNQVVRLWDAKTGRPIGKDLKCPGGVVSMAFSPDGKTIVTGSFDGMVRVWDISSGRESDQFDSGHSPVLAMALSPDGRRMVTSNATGTARLWETETHAAVGAPMHHPSDAICLAFQPDGRAVMTATIDGMIRVWELSTGLHPQRTWKPGGRVSRLAFRPDGRAILADAGGEVARLWDSTTGAPLGPPMRHHGVIESLGFSPDGQIALTACLTMIQKGEDFEQKAEVYRWNAGNGAALGRLVEIAESVKLVAYLPDGRQVLVASSSPDSLDQAVSIRLFDSMTGAPLSKPIELGNERVDLAILSPDGRQILTGSRLGKTAQLWDVATGRPVGPPIKHPDWVMALAFRSDGKVFATGCRDKVARLWDATTGQPIGQPMAHGYPVVALAFSPDGQTLLAGCQDDYGKNGEARLWNAANGQLLAPPLNHAHAVTAVAFRPDGKAVATGDATLSIRGPGDGDISVWDVPVPLSGDIEEVQRQIQVWTGLKLQDADRFEALAPEIWQEQKKRTEKK